MPRKRIQIVVSKCKRCGCQLATASRSIYGNDVAKRKYELICKNCLTDEEYNDMNKNQADFMRNNFCKG